MSLVKLLVYKSQPLSGIVQASGAKNAALPILAATILSERFMGEFRELKVQVYNGLSEHPLIVHAKVGLKLKLGQSINIGYRSV